MCLKKQTTIKPNNCHLEQKGERTRRTIPSCPIPRQLDAFPEFFFIFSILYTIINCTAARTILSKGAISRCWRQMKTKNPFVVVPTRHHQFSSPLHTSWAIFTSPSSSAKPNGNCSEVSTEFCPRIESNCQLKTLFMSTTLALSIPKQRFLLDFFYAPLSHIPISDQRRPHKSFRQKVNLVSTVF